MPTRREALLTGLFGAGYVGLRALATGLPAWYLLDPRRANASNLQCTIQARANLQYLVVSASSAGDSLNCNVPGTYTAAPVIHPQQAEMAATALQLGAKSYMAAKPWSTLSAAQLGRTSFFHHVTQGSVHGDHPKVMRLMGGTQSNEMYMSIYAKYLGPCLSTVQSEPVAVGVMSALELVSYQGRTLSAISPLQFKQLLTGSKTDPLVQLRSIRDSALDQLNALAKSDGTLVQQQFLEQMALSQTQVRQLSDSLGNTLAAITDNGVPSQALAAAALFAANVTPVVTMHIPFGGDNHNDADLQDEADQCVSGVQGIQSLMSALAALGLTDKVTFATMNVFGRTLNGEDKVTARQGRDHDGDHCVTVMMGKNVAPGVVGGVTTVGGGTTYVAGDIDSASGTLVAGGDIPRIESQAALAKTLGAVLGIPQSVMAGDIQMSAGGKVVTAALNGVSP